MNDLAQSRVTGDGIRETFTSVDGRNTSPPGRHDFQKWTFRAFMRTSFGLRIGINGRSHLDEVVGRPYGELLFGMKSRQLRPQRINNGQQQALHRAGACRGTGSFAHG
jgi:hypothetical protein